MKYVYFFAPGEAEGDIRRKDLLGGKGAGLHEMTHMGIPVPPGFTISTQACLRFYEEGEKVPEEVLQEVAQNLKKLEQVTGKGFGDPQNPLLVSVRSGAAVSMPGMMDTILNLGLNDITVDGLARVTGNPRFAWDSYRRFIQMFGDVVLRIDKRLFEELSRDPQDLELEALKGLVRDYQALVRKEWGREFPQDPVEQLHMAIRAVFLSWNNPRAIFYRKEFNIPDHLGTAVNVQAMVFGNRGETSGTGVGFTRNPATGEKELYGEFLANAQGEDVVAGIRTPRPLKELQREMPQVYRELERVAHNLEKHFRDVQDFEFTIEEGKLYLLQTRAGKRTGLGAARIAYDMVQEGLITKEEALLRVEPENLAQFLFPVFDPDAKAWALLIAQGLPASTGAAAGRVAMDAETAVRMARQGQRVILVRKETSPDDIHGMAAAAGILTARGGLTSHAAVVGRQMGKVCVVGAEGIGIDEKGRSFQAGAITVHEGDFISVDGFEGKVFQGDIPVMPSEVVQVLEGKLEAERSEKYRVFSALLQWADETRRLGVRANADTPQDARTARLLGAQGIGLCRTEHMFFAPDRLPIMQGMILARDGEERRRYLEQLLPMQREDFKALFREMDGYPVTIRLLDPPLHEFLPSREELMVEIKELELTRGDPGVLEEKKRVLQRVEELHEFNPMLGFRGCRLGVVMPEITRMQARAILEAACAVAREGVKVMPEIMVPLVSLATEIKAQKDLINEVAEEVFREYGERVPYSVGTMIEVPRAALTAHQVAREAEFFSFGTNDLTQTTFGFSRDDAGKFIRFYLESKVTMGGRAVRLLDKDPFVTLDVDGVGDLIRIAIERGRSSRPDLKIGICGEHGGDPQSVMFCHQVGMDYVSASPYRVPIARLAAAQAVLRANGT